MEFCNAVDFNFKHSTLSHRHIPELLGLLVQSQSRNSRDYVTGEASVFCSDPEAWDLQGLLFYTN